MSNNPIASSVSCHSFNKDGKQIAVSNNTTDVLIYAVSGEDASKWKHTHTLVGHMMHVTGIDWCHSTNMIVTTGHDRNAYVWKLEQNEWKPTLVILRIGRAATCVKWSPNGKKFAVGSGSKQIPVCHYEESQDMWVAQTIKKGPKSTILCVDWSPDSLLLIAGGCDFKCRIYSAAVPKTGDDHSKAIAWQSESEGFGNILAEFDSRGWIEACAFAPGGERFAFAGHDSTVHFGDIKGGNPEVQTILRRDLPLRSIVFLSDTLAVGGGYDMVPVVYEYKGSTWEETGPLDTGKSASSQPKAQKGAFGSAFSKFNTQASKGAGADASAVLPTRHQNMINDIVKRSESSFTTSSTDGRILFWDPKKSY